ncbi:rhomboid-related protein 1 isoform X4 [Myotis yumanensis]|uniref:rhomboid-related protein 1 isoform X4 n=1 Tax=Myotis yumanensis TaxID=159337 RepID=UPI0038CF3B3B
MDRSSLLQLIQEQQLDPENTGFIGADTFTGLVHSHELPLDPAKLDMLVALAQSNERGQVCYQELVDLIIVFLCYGARLNKWVLQTYHPEYMKSPLVYHPGHRARAWRFLTYMFMHVGLEQLGFNALLQLMIGVPLEMVHGLLRISLLYLAGVLAGSLTVSITDMRAPVVGGSGGVYALCSAHLANVVMNWAGMRCPYKLLRMVLALVCIMRNAFGTSAAGGWCCLPTAPSCSSPSSGTSSPMTCWVPIFLHHPEGLLGATWARAWPACPPSVKVCLKTASPMRAGGPCGLRSPSQALHQPWPHSEAWGC